MKIALISDIHGNLTALEAVLADIRRRGADRIICLGDLATLGPQPREVIARLRELDCPGIMGNHDAALLQPEAAEHFHIAPPLIPTLNWCAEQLDETDLAFLSKLVPTGEIPLAPRASLKCYHGSPFSNTDNIFPQTPEEELRRCFGNLHAAVFAGGHTHIAMVRPYHDALVVNPGSVGCPFAAIPPPGGVPALLPWAEYAEVMLQDNALSVTLHRIPFDTDAYKKVLSQSTLPIREWWISQYSLY
ncbi:MAG: metallophosphoesterase family protein [Calditrichae bacterium]|nr:metallophosphoesterase family protein [Calditrichota bacterium]MCB9089883.1 metallophosphoesterase family protein [Calditrichia bacterium]